MHTNITAVSILNIVFFCLFVFVSLSSFSLAICDFCHFRASGPSPSLLREHHNLPESPQRSITCNGTPNRNCKMCYPFTALSAVLNVFNESDCNLAGRAGAGCEKGRKQRQTRSSQQGLKLPWSAPGVVFWNSLNRVTPCLLPVTLEGKKDLSW